jgi:hypothetical protein
MMTRKTVCSDALKPKDGLEPTITLLERAIKTNHTLQHALQLELECLTREIDQNRMGVDHMVHTMVQRESTSNDATKIGFVYDTTDLSSKSNKSATNQRRWTKRFFVDHKGSEPQQNDDTLRRREIEKQSFFYHTQPPWSSKESIELVTTVQNLLDTTNTRHRDNYKEILEDDSRTRVCFDLEDENRVSNSSSKKIDYDVVAGILLRRPLKEHEIRKRNWHRSSEECKIQYENEKKRKTDNRFFKDGNEMSVLSNVVASMVSTDGASNMNWEKVAIVVQQQSQSTNHCNAWDCILAYHTKLKTPLVQMQTASSTWIHEEDEILLKFIAALGPQAVIESKNTLIQHTLCTQLLINKSKKQIFIRANQTLLNPNIQRTDWSDYEERRLPICMKIYNEKNAGDNHQLYRASTHCYGRSTKSVVDKWNRSINPVYSAKPFTKEEDDTLLHVMRSAFAANGEIRDSQKQSRHIGWTKLSQTFFPNRHPQRLQSRWAELATDQDIVNRERAKIEIVTSNEKNPTR